MPERFWDKVSPCPMSGCWHWGGHINSVSGVPLFIQGNRRTGRKSLSARRYAHDTLIGGRSHSRLFSACENDACCNPVHTRELLTPEVAGRNRKRSAQKYQRANKEKRESERIQKVFGLNSEDIKRMLAQQENACAICKTEFKDKVSPQGRIRRGWNIDHDHGRGTNARGLLCAGCNLGIGSLCDSPARLRAAADYLIKHGKSEDS